MNSVKKAVSDATFAAERSTGQLLAMKLPRLV
jgi:hypothetical protein